MIPRRSLTASRTGGEKLSPTVTRGTSPSRGGRELSAGGVSILGREAHPHRLRLRRGFPPPQDRFRGFDPPSRGGFPASLFPSFGRSPWDAARTARQTPSRFRIT